MRSGGFWHLPVVALCWALWLPLGALAADRSWVERSDRNSAIVLEMLGGFAPEQASSVGVERFDAAVLDLRPGHDRRYDATAGRVLERLSAKLKTEKDSKVSQDLEILIDAVRRMRHTRRLEHRLLIPYFDLPKHVFQGLQILLDARNG